MEYGLAFLLLLRWRFPLAGILFYVLAVGFHMAIASLLSFGIFMLIAIAALTVFFPAAWIDRLAGPRRQAPAEPPSCLPPAYRLEWPLRCLGGFIIAMIAIFNLYSVSHYQRVPQWSVPVMALTFEQQHWHFFAPDPPKTDGWYVFEVTMQDGRTIDAWQNGPLVDGKPADVAGRFYNQRWRRWLQNLTDIDIPDNRSWRQATLDFLSKGWLREHPQENVERFRLVLMQEPTPEPGGRLQRVPAVLAEELPPSPPRKIQLPAGPMTP
jgi:hypothetical protein